MAERFVSYWTSHREVQARVNEHLSELHQSIDVDVPISGSSLDSQEICDANMAESAEEPDAAGDHAHEFESNQSSTHFDEYEPIVFNSESSDATNSDTDVEDSSILSSLCKWALSFHIPLCAIAALLFILRPHFPYLPKDPRTLLQTKTSYVVKALVSGGFYHHFGLAQNLSMQLKHHIFEGNQIHIQVNVDGLPLFKSSNDQFWPILCRVINTDFEPFIVGLFYGKSKPSNLEFMQEFVDEAIELKNTGLRFENDQYYVQISSFVCDAPARSFLKCTKSHCGYSGCEKCTQSGLYLNRRMTFPELKSSLRTDIAFQEMQDEEHHKGQSMLLRLGIGMVSQFPLDYMHLICLGVVRRLILTWMKGPLPCRIGNQTVQRISEALVGLRSYIPKEFARKPRGLNEVERWKASEFRQFLLYSGPVVLLGKLPHSMYRNFLLLFVGMHILLTPVLCNEYCDFAESVLALFVEQSGELYGKEILVYNMHCAIHLANDVRRFGYLDNISCFPFENFLSKLKKMVRKPSFALQQVIRRISEKSLMKNESYGHIDNPHRAYPILSKDHADGPLPINFPCCLQFKKVELELFSISIDAKDKCIRIGNDIGVVENIVSIDLDIFVIFRKFKKLESFFDYPLHSDALGIFQVSRLCEVISSAALHDVTAKCVMIPHNDKFVVIPMTQRFV